MSTSIDINSLFQAVQSSGALSTASLQALTIADIGAMIGESGKVGDVSQKGEYYADYPIAAGYRFL